MAFTTQEFKSHGDPRQFPGHKEVLAYVQEFGEEVRNYVSFNETVLDVKQLSIGKWNVTTSKRTLQADVVCVCNGHYEKYILPKIKGMETFKG